MIEPPAAAATVAALAATSTIQGHESLSPSQPNAAPKQTSQAASTIVKKFIKGSKTSNSAPERMCETKESEGIAPMQQETKKQQE
jgi:hypothetical protein